MDSVTNNITSKKCSLIPYKSTSFIIWLCYYVSASMFLHPYFQWIKQSLSSWNMTWIFKTNLNKLFVLKRFSVSHASLMKQLHQNKCLVSLFLLQTASLQDLRVWPMTHCTSWISSTTHSPALRRIHRQVLTKSKSYRDIFFVCNGEQSSLYATVFSLAGEPHRAVHKL